MKDPKNKKGKRNLEELTAKERKFCHEYVKDFDSARAYAAAGYKADNPKSVAAAVYDLKRLPRVHAYIKDLQLDLEKTLGVSRAQVLKMHLDIANTSIGQLHKTWITRRNFEDLNDVEKAVIQSIDTKVITNKKTGEKTEFVKIILYDRQKALDSISAMLGYNEPDKLEILANKKTIAGMFPFGQ